MSNQGLMSPPASVMRNNSNMSALTQTSTNSSATSQQSCKIKVWFSDQDCVVIRMPPVGQFRWADLYKKLKERRTIEYGDTAEIELAVSYRDEREGKMFAMENDSDLRVALERNGKLTLDVRVVR